MKKGILILGMVVALVAVMVMPAAVSAETDTVKTTNVTGNYGRAALTVTAPGAVAFGEFTFGDNVLAGADGSIAIAAHSQNGPQAPWQVTASDATTGPNKGFMLNGTTTPLLSKLQISKDTGTNYSDASVGFTYSGTGGFPAPLPFKAKQTVGNDEAEGAYTIIITFTGSLGF